MVLLCLQVNPLGPILFESPRPLTSSLSPQSSDMTEAGIRLFTQSPPRPEESRQAVCEVPIYNTTLPSGKPVYSILLWSIFKEKSIIEGHSF